MSHPIRPGSARLRALLLCLAFLLPFAQLGAYAHALSHAGNIAAGKDSTPHTACELCAACSALDGAAPVAALALALESPDPVVPGQPAAAAYRPALEVRYRSRAPPIPLA